MAVQSPEKITLIQIGAPMLSKLGDALRDLGHALRYDDSDESPGGEVAESDAIILSIAPAAGGASQPLIDMDFSDWMENADNTQFRLLTILQKIHSALGERPCKILIVGPSIGLTGAAGHTALATAAEGQRGLMKSLARQWGPQLRFGWLSVWAPMMFPEIDQALLPEQCELGDYTPSLGKRPDWADVARAAVGLLTAMDSLTGQTVLVDGGEWMLP